MNSTVNGRPIVARTGYIVEFNALWYNAARFVADLLSDDTELSSRLNGIADKAAPSFVSTFLNEYGYLLDFVDGNMMDWSVRPNMILQLLLIIHHWMQNRRKALLILLQESCLLRKESVR